MMNQLKVLIVLYNKKIEESETIMSLSKIVDKIQFMNEIIVWDNSKVIMPEDEQVHLKRILHPANVQYIGTGKNTSLSIIYNSVIRTLSDKEIFVVLDHDSNLTLAYFKALEDSIEKYPQINLFLPIIKYNKTIVSPANSWYFKGSYWKEEKFGLIETKNQNAINSGMAIRAAYLKNDFEGYNENLAFYGTDSDFMYKYGRQNHYFCVINAVINHTLDFFDNNSIDSKLFRYKEIKKAALINMKQRGFFIYMLCYFYFLIYSIKLIISFKDIRFLTLK